MPRIATSLALCLLAAAGRDVHAFEGDVHFGLTRWLAEQAGYTVDQAKAIAIGDQRVNSGDMQFIELVSAYACRMKDLESAQRVMEYHFPTSGALPGAPQQRAVAAGSEAAWAAARAMARSQPRQTGFLLYKLGGAIHTLQDSWSNKGVPDVPRANDGVAECDAMLAWASPASRGGWNSHRADLTHAWVADTVAMAAASYEALAQYPPINEVKRSPRPWAELVPAVEAFARAATKTDKAQWFRAHGIEDVSFLEGISLPDGPTRFDGRWPSRKLPALPTIESDQHHIDAALRGAMSHFFGTWATTHDFEALAASVLAPGPPTQPANAARRETVGPDRAELVARLQVWRLRDHGRIAEIAHASGPLTARQKSVVAAAARAKDAYADYAQATDAFFPLVVKGAEPSPLLGFLIAPVESAPSGNPRAIAFAKFRHVPYDTVQILVERVDGRWVVRSIDAIVEH